MTWFLSIIVAALSAAVGLVLAGFIANMAVTWYRISSFEGGSGYYVVGLALVGGLAGGVIGLIAARAVAAGANPGFFKALGFSLSAIIVIAGSIGGVARLNADVPPEVDGQELRLAVEFRWPTSDTASPAAYPGTPYMSLGSSSGRTTRKSEEGPLFVDLARREDGHWIVPGAARIFTTRGDRSLDVGIGAKRFGGFLLPPAGNTNVPMAEWSEWFPRAKPGAPPLPDGFSYRYRVMRSTDPVRTDAIGPFTIETVSGRFSRRMNPERITAGSTFRIAYHGQPLEAYQEVGAVSVIGGSKIALLVQVTDDAGEGQCLLITEDGSKATSTSIGTCYGNIPGEPLTADSAVYHAARQRGDAGGWIDQTSFAVPGLYLVNNTVVDSRTLEFHPVVDSEDARRVASVPPVSVSPDERSFVWISADGSDPTVIGVSDWKSGTSYTLPVDASRMRFRDRDDVDPQWVSHHFVWIRDGAGIARLTARSTFTPLPYRGSFVPGREGAVTQYTLSPGGAALRQAMVDVLIAKLGAVRLPDELNGFYIVLTIDGKRVMATVGGGVSFSMGQGTGDPALMTKLASTLDAELATGKHDALFVSDKE
ncbi:MAG: hypothetical protein ABMA00_00535 [Gemmatimonas sp.]